MYLILLVIQAVSIVFLFIESGYVFVKMNTGIHKYLFLSCIATLVNNTGYFLIMLSTSEEQYLTGVQMSYLGRVWIPFSLFAFVMAVCKIRIKKPLMIGLSFFHAFIFFLVLTCRRHKLYYSSMEYVEKGDWSDLVCGDGIFHKIYSVTILAYIVIGLFCLFRATYREKIRTSKRRMLFVTMAIVSESAGFLIYLTGVTGMYD